jgi:hypothetical protein
MSEKKYKFYNEDGIVFRAEDYVFSSAIDYCGGKGILDIEMIE